MPVVIEKEDLRKIKTRRALYISLSSLLGSNSFEKVTVTDICEEALISRATFYTYFLDKYDLLKYWLLDLWAKNKDKNNTYDQIEKAINKYIHENESLIKNLVCDADCETLGILFDFILNTVNLVIEEYNGGKTNVKNIVLSNLYAGGMIFYLFWLIKNRFPEDVPPMNNHVHEIITKIQMWLSEEK